jgi:hypothetical protein
MLLNPRTNICRSLGIEYLTLAVTIWVQLLVRSSFLMITLLSSSIIFRCIVRTRCFINTLALNFNLELLLIEKIGVWYFAFLWIVHYIILVSGENISFCEYMPVALMIVLF